MAAVSFSLIAVPEVSAALLRYKAENPGVVTFKVRNEGSNPVTLKVQQSDDNSTFADISGSTKTVEVGGRADVSVVPSKPYVQLVAGGDSYVKLDVAYEGMAFEGNLDILLINQFDAQNWPVQPSV